MKNLNIMKKLFTIIALVFITNVTAQQFKIGVKFGLASSSLTEATTTGNYTTAMLGLQTEYKLKSNFSLGAELYYTRIGAENNNTSDYLYLDYLNLPVLAKFNVSEKFNIHIGPELGFLLSSSANQYNANDFFKSVNFAGVVGVGYNLGKSFTLDARYHLGLTDISEFIVSKTRLLSISVSYYF